MKPLILLAWLLLSVGSAQADSEVTSKPTPSRPNKAQLGTSFRFDASSLHGKYQSAPGTTATVENDKFLDDLLSPPKNFKDRAELEAERN